MKKNCHEKLLDFVNQIKQRQMQNSILIEFLQSIAFQVEVLEENYFNVRQELYDLYESIKKNQLIRIIITTPLNWKSISKQKGKRIFSSDLYGSTDLSIQKGLQQTQDTQKVLREKITLIEDLKKQINNLQQRLQIQSKNCQWQVDFYFKEKQNLNQFLRGTVSQMVNQRKQNKKLNQQLKQLEKKNFQLIKLYEQQIIQNQKLKKKKKYKIITNNIQKKRSLINELEQIKIQKRSAKIQEKLLKIDGVGMIHSSCDQV